MCREIDEGWELMSQEEMEESCGERIILHNSDCYETLKGLADNSVDAIITDPPYDIGFMGKGWDKKSLITNVDFWKECLRVLKHGGHLLAFGHSRTSHRMVSAVEDAGFEIRDTIMWIYGSGFPKSHNVGKAVDKKLGNERKKIGEVTTHDIRGNALMESVDDKTKKKISSMTYEITSGNSEWEGWGSALKPAHEPIILARKPLEGTIVDNVHKWGVGALNIDATRIGTEVMPALTTKTEITDIGWEKKGYTTPERTGRWATNVMFDEESHELLGEQKKFFYCAKVNKKERNAGVDKNNHPTVKPIALMEYLIKLVTREAQTVFDPFMGSGTTGIASKKLHRNFIGCEKEKEYYEIAKARIENWE